MDFNINDIKNEMIVKFPFFNGVISNVDYIEDRSVGTAGAFEHDNNDREIFYNPDFFKDLTNDEQVFVLAHETCHLAFNHIARRKDKDPEIWNIATDAVINAFLKKENLPLPSGGVDIEDADKYDAETLYDEYINKYQKDSEQNSMSSQESGEEQEQDSNQSGMSSQESGEEQNQDSNQNGMSSQESGEEQKQDSNQNGMSSQESSEEQEQDSNQSGMSSQGENQDDKLTEIVDKMKEYVKNGSDKSSDHSMWDKPNSKQNENDGQQEKSETDNKKTDLKEILEKIKREIKNSKYIEDEENDSELKNKSSNNDSKENKNSNKDNRKKDLQKEIEKISKLGEKKSFEKNTLTRKEQLQELKEELMNKASGAGSTTNADVKRFRSIGRAKPLVDWRYILKETTKYDVDWSSQHAYIEDGILHSNLEEQPISETEIVLDTSGSVSKTLLKNFLRECKNIMDHSKIKVGCFDTEFYGFEEIRTEKDIENLNFIGFGGTDFDAAVNAFTRRVDNKIIFTDGYAPMPKKPLDAIWIVYGQEKINPKGGKVIYIDENHLNKLLNFNTSSNVKKKVK